MSTGLCLCELSSKLFLVSGLLGAEPATLTVAGIIPQVLFFQHKELMPQSSPFDWVMGYWEFCNSAGLA